MSSPASKKRGKKSMTGTPLKKSAPPKAAVTSEGMAESVREAKL